MSEPIIARLNAELKKVMADPEIQNQLVEQGVEPMYTTPEGLTSIIRRDTEKWGSS